jgi:sphingomyelin phosphodiesterase 2
MPFPSNLNALPRADLLLPLQDPLGKRLDYIFAGSGDIHAVGGGWVVKQAKVGMMMRHPELGCSLSDHFSVEATLVFHPHGEPEPSPPLDSNATASKHDSSPTVTGTLQPTDEPATPDKSKTESAVHNGAFLQLQSPAPSSTHLLDTTYQSQLNSFLHPSSDTLLPPAVYDTILFMVRTYTAREQSQLTWRSRHFFASLVVSIGCLVGVWFVPGGMNYISFVLVLVSTLGLTAGTVDGLMALLFFRSELKALKEFEWELRNARRLACGADAGDEDGHGRDGDWE